MLRIERRAETEIRVGLEATLSLPWDLRSKSRLRAKLSDGREVAITLERGRPLREGDVLITAEDELVRVEAANEPVSTARTDHTRLLARACYHLGNRHVALQVGDGWVRYQHDHVLDEMCTKLGLDVVFEQAPFEPEGGAYGDAGGHLHAH